MTARSDKTPSPVASNARARRSAEQATIDDTLPLQHMMDRIQALETARAGDAIRLARLAAERDALERDIQLNIERYRRESHIYGGAPQGPATAQRMGSGLSSPRPLQTALLPDVSPAVSCSEVEFRRLRDQLRAAMKSKDWASAAEHAVMVIRCRPSRAVSWIQYGHAAKELGDTALAERAYFRALALDPGNADLCEHLGHMLRLRGEIALAADVFRGGLIAAPWATVLRDKLADMNEPAPLVLARKPAAPRRKIDLWWFRRLSAGAQKAARAGRWGQAAARYRLLTRLYPADTRLHIQLGHALKEQGSVPEAEASYRRALALHPLNNDAWLHLGHALKLLGRMTEAQLAYQTALRLNPESASAEMEIRMINQAK